MLAMTDDVPVTESCDFSRPALKSFCALWAKAATEAVEWAKRTRQTEWRHLTFSDEIEFQSWLTEAREVHARGDLFVSKAESALDGEEDPVIHEQAIFEEAVEDETSTEPQTTNGSHLSFEDRAANARLAAGMPPCGSVLEAAEHEMFSRCVGLRLIHGGGSVVRYHCSCKKQDFDVRAQNCIAVTVADTARLRCVSLSACFGSDVVALTVCLVFVAAASCQFGCSVAPHFAWAEGSGMMRGRANRVFGRTR